LDTPYSAKIAHLRAAGLEQPGALSTQERRACAEGEPPPRLAGYVDKVRRHAYRVTDADIAGLREAGCSEEEIFEATVCAALGAGLGRLERGLALLQEAAR
jgi:alkylhydroperoxidase family enzyme